MSDYPNERDCEHGHRRGKCELCDRDEEIAALKLQLSQVSRRLVVTREEIRNAYNRAADADICKAIDEMVHTIATRLAAPAAQAGCEIDPSCTFYPRGQCDRPDTEQDARAHCRAEVWQDCPHSEEQPPPAAQAEKESET